MSSICLQNSQHLEETQSYIESRSSFCTKIEPISPTIGIQFLYVVGPNPTKGKHLTENEGVLG